jgi:hypothetical protein
MEVRMQRFIGNVRKSVITSAMLLVMLFLPVSGLAAADTVDPNTGEPVPCVAPPDTDYGTGVHSPTGSDAVMFTYQCDGQYAGKWTSQYYVYDPVSGIESPLYDPSYSYDCAGQQWYVTEWHYSPARGIYVQQTVPGNPPAGTGTGCPAPVVPSGPVVVDPATIDSNKTVDTDGDGIFDSPTTPETLALAQLNGGSAINLDGTLNTTINNNTTALMNNGIISFAGTGNALVMGNTTGGSATSGNAQAIANIINMLQSSSNILGTPDMITFTANINGDVNGDLLLDPAKLSTVQPATISTALDNNLTINNSLDAAINNNIDLDAVSGAATVANNTTGGNATTGNADAVANIVNILNSAVTAGRSFLGVININGNLNGDILLPPNFVDTLLANNVPHYTVNTAAINSDVTVNNTNDSTINNHVNAGAQSGSAGVTGNTTGGNATSGLANTDLTVFNLTGSSVVASNDLLVFVNVLGTWYGMIMNAPAGTTAASLGGGVTANTTINNDATLNNSNTEAINNNVNVNAKTGNALVNHNTTGGNATSGDATASVNILNMINNSLSLNGWFGLLFINVFGTWNGSFGVNTAAGNPLNMPDANKGGSDSGPMFQFVSTTPGGSTLPATYTYYGNGHGTTTGTSNDGSVLDATTSAVKKAATTLPSSDDISPLQKATNKLLLPFIGAGLAFLILLAGERHRFLRRP